MSNYDLIGIGYRNLLKFKDPGLAIWNLHIENIGCRRTMSREVGVKPCGLIWRHAWCPKQVYCVCTAGLRNRLVRQQNCGHVRDVYGTVILSERKWKLNAGSVNDPAAGRRPRRTAKAVCECWGRARDIYPCSGRARAPIAHRNYNEIIIW